MSPLGWKMDEEACKIIVGGEVRTIIDPDDKKTIKSIFDKRRSDGFTIKTVGEIASSGMAFFIPAYQRGYRWGEDEVCALFDDIDEFLKKDEDGFYCLQPLIVRKRDSFEVRKSLESIVSGGESETQSGETPEFVYELIDGQQRLTTIWLLLFALAGGKPPYRIYYEIPRNVDEDFILSAKGLLERKCATLAEGARLDLRKEIEGKAVFLLYEVVEKGEESSEKVFRQINKGKIELTNAELFKALLLDDELAKTEQERREQEIIAFEWDKIEQSLRNDSFWFFISNDKSDERTRIDYILDIYADTLNDDKKLDPEKDRYSFLAVQAHLKSKGDYSFTDIKEIWEEIVFIHDKLRSYYSNPAIYHLLGFLVAVSGKSRRQTEEMVFYVYSKCRDKGEADTEKFLKSEIANLFKDSKTHRLPSFSDLNYGDNKVFEFLLFSNIYPYLKGNGGRFSFENFHSGEYDIEHINPQQPNDNVVEMKTALVVYDYLLAEHCPFLTQGEKPKDAETALSELRDNKEKLRQYFKPGEDEIANLVLLNRDINRSYKNALFVTKRAKIIESDGKGEFIPIATKSVFLKHFTENPRQFAVWDENDKRGYLDYLEEIETELGKW